MSWAKGVVLEAVRDIGVRKPPQVMEGIYREDGTPVRPEELKVIRKGSKFRVIEDNPKVLLSRVPSEKDAGKVRLIWEVEDVADWRSVS